MWDRDRESMILCGAGLRGDNSSSYADQNDPSLYIEDTSVDFYEKKEDIDDLNSSLPSIFFYFSHNVWVG